MNFLRNTYRSKRLHDGGERPSRGEQEVKFLILSRKLLIVSFLLTLNGQNLELYPV